MGRVDLIAFDGSPCSRYAFDWYLDNMHRSGDRVVLVHVVEYNIDIGIPGVTADVDAICAAVKEKKEQVEALTNEYMSALRSRNVPCKLLTLSGNRPGEAIVKAVADENVSSVVMGTRGLSRIKRTLLGSVSEYVVHHANCPVTIVRQKD